MGAIDRGRGSAYEAGLGTIRSLVAMSAIAIRECRMYSMADLASSARPFSAGFCEPFRGTDTEARSTPGVVEISIACRF